MGNGIEAAFRRLRDLGSPEELQALAGRSGFEAPPVSTNSHIHLPPNFSAFRSVDQAIELAAAQAVGVLGASNYYDFNVYGTFADAAWQHAVFPLFGLEIIALLEDLRQASILVNDPGNPGRMYLCGKGTMRFAPMNRGARDLMDWIRQSDAERMRRMVDLVARIFAANGVDTGLDEAAIAERIARRCAVDRGTVWLQERHVAQAFQEEFFRMFPPAERVERLSFVLGRAARIEPGNPLKVQQEIRSALMKVGRPAFVTERFVDFDQAYRLILELGGIPCYPTLADGANPVCAYEASPDELAEDLRRRRIFCAELIPIRNEPETLARYVRTLRGAGLVITGGTEHNTTDLLPLEPRCVRGQPLPPGVREIFAEGACVVAAHQFLALHGRRGYVDEDGVPAPEFLDSESRISWFARLGAAVVARYHEKSTGKEGTSRDA